MQESMYYSYRKIDSYNSRIRIILSRRGLGKTFGALMKGIREFYKTRRRFIYVVETEKMIEELSINKGEKFLCNILEFLKSHPTKRNELLLSFLEDDDTEIEEDEKSLIKSKTKLNMITGRTIKLGGEVAGYIVSLSGYGDLKRNNFIDVKYIIVDEFIPEKTDIRYIENPKKLVSIIQSISRLKQDVIVYLLGNSIRLNDPILDRFHCCDIKLGEMRKIKDEKGLFCVCHYVDPKEYPQFAKASDDSVAGRLAKIMQEESLDLNVFANAIDKNLLIPERRKASSLLFCLHGQDLSIRINQTKDHIQYYVMEDYGENERQRICIDNKFRSPGVLYMPEWKDVLINKFENKQILFDTSMSYLIFKQIIGLA